MEPRLSSPRRWKKRWRNSSLNILVGSLTTSPLSTPPTSASPSESTGKTFRRSFPPISPPILHSYSSLRSPFEYRDGRLPDFHSDATLRLSGFNSRQPSPDEMDSTVFLNPPAIAPSGRIKQVREAKEMERAVLDRVKGDVVAPPYEFLELTGKGTYGRVFKCRRRTDNQIVAVKIIDVDTSDYKLDAAEKDQAIKDFTNEISILRQLTDGKVRNINAIHDAFAFHSQLWIVSDYCPGGSIYTLMKASPTPGLEEKYIIAISRELAIALKHVHEIGIIHRDVKAANVLISQDGMLQLCDFGVSGVLESSAAKRSTIIGTPHWMPPEMHDEPTFPQPASQGFGTEIDCWAFGCTVYELATGSPPNARIAPEKLVLFMKKAPRLEGGDHSPELRDFIAFCLVEDPVTRPNVDQILKHPFIANTSKKYPTSLLRDLIERYALWEQTGGQRHSLFAAHGAAGPGRLDDDEEDDDWNFSTTDDFNTMMFSNLQTPTVTAGAFDGHGDITPRQPTMNSAIKRSEDALLEKRIRRGGLKMGRLFNEDALPYSAAVEGDSDLPLRTFGGDSNVRESVIDLDAAMDMDNDIANLDLADIPTIRAKQSNRFLYDDDDDDEGDGENDEDYYEQSRNLTKRKTRDWKFPTTALTMPAPAEARPRTQDWTFPKMASLSSDPEATLSAEPPQDEDDDSISPLIFAPTGGTNLAPAFRPKLRHIATEPLGHFGENVAPSNGPSYVRSSPDRTSMIDLDAVDINGFTNSPSHPSTSGSFDTQTTPYSSFDTTASAQSGPFDFDDKPAARFSSGLQGELSQQPQRQSFHMHSQSEPNRLSDNSAEFGTARAVHARGSSLGSDRPSSIRASVDELREAEANEADTEETIHTEAEEGYGSGLEMNALQRQQHFWDDLGTTRHGPQRSLSFKDRLKPGSSLFKARSHEPPAKRQPSGNSARLNGSLRTARPSWALTQQNVERQPSSEYSLQTQRWLGSVNSNSTNNADVFVEPPIISRSQSFAEDATTADESDAFFMPTRPKRSHRAHLQPAMHDAAARRQHMRDDSYSTLHSGASATNPTTSHHLHHHHHHLRDDSYDAAVLVNKPGSRDDTESSGSAVILASLPFPDIAPPRAAALYEDASEEDVVWELERLLEDFATGLRTVKALVQDVGARKRVTNGVVESVETVNA